MIVDQGLVGTLQPTLVLVAIVPKGTGSDTSVIDILGKVLVIAPGGTVPGDIVGIESLLALVHA